MSTQHTTQPLSEDRHDTTDAPNDELSFEVESLADVIEMPNIDAPSWYQRNSGALPKSEAGMADTHRRTELPKPQYDDDEPLIERIKAIFGR